MQGRAQPGVLATGGPLPSAHDSPPKTRPNADILEFTPAERWHEFERWQHEDDGLFHLSSIKELAGIGSGETHVSIQQITDLHRELGHIVSGRDKPASAGLTLGSLAEMTNQSSADLAAAAAVDSDALQRHFDGEGPLSKVAYLRVIRAMVAISLVEA
jgi:hypothetical protein